MKREQIDILWAKAIGEAVNAGEQSTRYHFAALVAAAEREECAKVCEEEICACCWDDDTQAAAEHLADTIRARGQQ